MVLTEKLAVLPLAHAHCLLAPCCPGGQRVRKELLHPLKVLATQEDVHCRLSQALLSLELMIQAAGLGG